MNFFLLFCFPCDSRGIQTHNLLIRSQMLYSVELGSLSFLKASAKVRSFWETTKYFGNFLQKKFLQSGFLLENERNFEVFSYLCLIY